MRGRLGLGIVAMLATGAATPPPAPPTVTVERVVMLMRHGIRPPTKPKPVPPAYSIRAWPTWPVGWGLLTPRGARGAALLGESDRRRWSALLGEGCPAPGAVVVKASEAPRAIATAQSWASAALPGCAVPVAHPADGEPDAIFHGLDDEPA